MTDHDLIHKLQKRIVEIYYQENLSCIRGLDSKYEIKDKQALTWYMNITQKCIAKFGNQFNYLKNMDDLVLCSDEIMHFTALTILYRPFINNPIEDAFSTSEGLIFPNFQNLEAKRYYMYSDVVCEKIYNYWDRIGDLIASFFPDLHKPKNIFFNTAIKKVPEEYRSLSSFNWLQSFSENEYQEINLRRIKVVHYATTDTTSRHDHIFKGTNKKEMKEWVQKRFELADYFKNHINLTIEGFYQTLSFLEEIKI